MGLLIASLSVPTVGDKGELPDSLPSLVTVERRIEEHFGVKIAKYEVNGELFFASSNDL